MSKWENVRLYGQVDDERLHLDLDVAIETWFDHCNLVQGDERLPLTLYIYEHTVLPPGESGDGKLMSGADIVDYVCDRFAENCGFEEIGDDYDEAARDPLVIAAFDEARAVLVSKQRFYIADKATRKIAVTFTAVDEHLIPSWTVGEWEPL